MKVLVCFKIVHDENELAVNPDKTIDDSKASYVISPYDCNAVGAAMNVAALREGSVVIAATVGGERVENGKIKKSILSRGPSELYAVKGDSLDNADSITLASTLKSLIEKIGGVDLVICGEGSADVYSQQTGNMLGILMGLPTVNSVSAICSADDHSICVERSGGEGVEVLSLSLPAVISVNSDICIPKIPSMKDILAAGKTPSTVYAQDALDAAKYDGITAVSVKAPESTERKQIVIKGDGEDQVAEFYANIRKALA